MMRLRPFLAPLLMNRIFNEQVVTRAGVGRSPFRSFLQRMYRTRARIGACRPLRQQGCARCCASISKSLICRRPPPVQGHRASSPQVGFFYHGVYTRLWWRPRRRTPWPNSSMDSRTIWRPMFSAGGQMPGPSIVFACDTAPELLTARPTAW